MHKYDVNGDGVLGPQEFKVLAREAVSLGEAAPLGEDIYEMSFEEEKLGFSVKNSLGDDTKVVVSKVKDASLVGKITPDDEILAINGVPIAHQKNISNHEELAAKVKTLTARPLHVSFKKTAAA